MDLFNHLIGAQLHSLVVSEFLKSLASSIYRQRLLHMCFAQFKLKFQFKQKLKRKHELARSMPTSMMVNEHALLLNTPRAEQIWSAISNAAKMISNYPINPNDQIGDSWTFDIKRPRFLSREFEVCRVIFTYYDVIGT